jgi:hypothetical protein
MKRSITLALLITVALTATQAEPRDREAKRTENRNYILRRQQAYQVQGVPTKRLIIGKRQIDIYPNGQMFEGDQLIGVRR